MSDIKDEVAIIVFVKIPDFSIHSDNAGILMLISHKIETMSCVLR